jgi:hypothetical protein
MEQMTQDKFWNEQRNGFWEMEEWESGRRYPKEAGLRVIADCGCRKPKSSLREKGGPS